MDRLETKKVLCEFLDTICAEEVSTFEADEELPFEESGLIDSLAILEIVSFLEEEFGIDFSLIGIDPEHLGSVGRIIDLIMKSDNMKSDK